MTGDLHGGVLAMRADSPITSKRFSPVRVDTPGFTFALICALGVMRFSTVEYAIR